MRRLFAVLATLGAAMLLFIPGALAEETDGSDAEQNEEEVKDGGDAAKEEEKKEDGGRDKKHRKPAKPEIKCRGKLSMGAKPLVECEWDEYPGAVGYKVIRRGGGERMKVYEGTDIDFSDDTVKYGTRYRYRVVVLDENDDRIRRSHWNKAIKRRGRIERLGIDCAVPEDEEPTPEGELDKEPLGLEGETEGEGADEAQAVEGDGHVVVCEWKKTTKEAAVGYEVWRKVRGERREMVDVVSLEEELRFQEELPADTPKAKYAVRAVDMDGRRVAHSKIEWVRFDR